MAKYVLTKQQIKRLIEGKNVVDSRGKSYIASERMKALLNKFDSMDVYEEYEVVFENGNLDIRKKEVRNE